MAKRLMPIKKPNRSVLTPGNGDALLDILLSFYDALVSLLGKQLPATVPGLQAITVSTHAALRLQVGDYAGQLGPRACIVAGRVNPLDGGEGVYVWDEGSTLSDDDSAVIQPLSLGGKNGRWRKGSF